MLAHVVVDFFPLGDLLVDRILAAPEPAASSGEIRLPRAFGAHGKMRKQALQIRLAARRTDDCHAIADERLEHMFTGLASIIVKRHILDVILPPSAALARWLYGHTLPTTPFPPQ